MEKLLLNKKNVILSTLEITSLGTLLDNELLNALWASDCQCHYIDKFVFYAFKKQIFITMKER